MIAGRFEIEQDTGDGTRGPVFRALDLARGAPVALKVADPYTAMPAERFHREAAMLAEVQHPGVVRYVAHGADPDGTLWLAMEWLEGETLRDRLARDELTIAQSVTLVRRAAEAAGAAHARSIVHRDLKPSNIFLVGGDPAKVKLIDFGLARPADPAARLTLSGATLGTPGYMSPEQARAAPDVDARADVFALGCVLFRCLTGRPPFVAPDVLGVLLQIATETAPHARELRHDVPEALDALLARLLARSPDDRPPDGNAAAAELAALGEVAEEVPPPPLSAPPAITTGELRILSAVLVRKAPAAGGPTSRPRELSSHARPELEALVAPFGGRLVGLADGSLVVLAAEEGAANDRATSAARSALALRRALPPGLLIAVVTGRADVSSASSLAGEVIEEAARRLGEGGERGVAIDEVTASLLGDRFDVRAGEHGLVLAGEREAPDPARTLLGKPTPCVGRERDLAFLEALLDESAGEPEARAVLVTAPPGVGKSRLLHELLRGRREGELLLGRGDPVRAGAPFGVLGPALRRAAGIHEGEALEVRREKLRERVARHVPEADRERVTEFLGELSGAPFDAAARPELRAARADPLLMGDQMRRAFEDFLAAELSAGPVLLAIDDLHWGDAPTIGYIDSALRLLHDRPLCVMAFARPDVDEVFPALWERRGVVRWVLRELGRSASERLARQVLGEGAPASLVERLAARAGGNALFLEELLRAEAAGRGEQMPETVMAMVESRLRALDPLARRVLRAASVLGRVFWEEGVRALLGGERVSLPLVDVLEDLCAREVLAYRGTEDPALGREVVFRHELVRAAAYAMLPPGDRALGHRLAASFLSRAGGEPAVIAEHFERGGERGAAVAWFLRAAEQALEASDLRAALALADRSAACGASGEDLGRARARQADALDELGDSVAMVRCASEALELLPPSSPLWPGAALRLSVGCGRLGDVEGSVRAARLVLDRLSEGAPGGDAERGDERRDERAEGARGERTGAEGARGEGSAGERTGAEGARGEGSAGERTGAEGAGAKGDWDESRRALLVAGAQLAFNCALSRREELAREMLDRIEAAAPAEDAVLRARIEMARGQLALMAGEPGVAVAWLEASAAAVERTGDVRLACRAHLMIGLGRKEAGDDEAAERALRRALEISERLGLPGVVSSAQHILTAVLARRGALDEACAMGREAAAAYASRGNARMERATRVYLALALLARGALEEAEVEARAAAVPLPAAPGLAAHAGAALAKVLLARGKVDEALASSGEAMRFLREGGRVEEGEAFIRLAHVEALDAAGQPEAATAALAEAEERLLARAQGITDRALRERFLTRIQENARTLEMAAARR